MVAYVKVAKAGKILKNQGTNENVELVVEDTIFTATLDRFNFY